MSTTNANRIAPDQRANITTPELLVLYSRLEAVIAQRDRCREAVERIAAMDGRAMPDHMLPEAIRICRAALRACEEKGGAE